nr:exodeoxyribonuclease VII small subunit [Advenella kashmirensis]
MVLTENAKSDTAALPDQFEAALGELESIVAQMEDNSMSLEASIAAYERGVRLARVCQDKLDTAEQQISVLRNNMLVPLADPGSSES